MNRRATLGALLFAAAASGAFAQEMLPALSDEGCRQLAAALERWLPARDAAAKEGLKDLARGLARSEAVEREILDIAEGRNDALAALRARSKRVAVPLGASYAPKCAAMFTGHAAVPTAIFTFGKAFRPRGPDVDQHSFPLDVDAASLDEWQRISKASIAFYEKKGFIRLEKDITSLVVMEPRAEPRDLTVIICANWNCGTTAFDDLKRACGDLPKGPALRLQPLQVDEEPAATAEVYARHAARLDPLVERAIAQ